MTVSVLCKSECILGEGPVWLPGTNKLMWVDIERGMMYEYDWDNRDACYWQLEKRVTLILPLEENNGLLLGMQGGVARFGLSDNRLQWLSDIEREIDGHRCNDGACDVQGRLWIGTMSTRFDEGVGSLYLFDENLSLHHKLGGLTIPNGLCWSLDNKRMYFIDSPKRCVQSFLFDAEKGSITFEKTVIEIPPSLGSPDGMTMDAEGMLWIAHYGGFGVYRWNPDTGSLLGKISLPAPHVTSCVFGGSNLDILFITTARQELSAEELTRYPESGNVFYARVNVKGLPTNACRFKEKTDAGTPPVYYQKQALL